MNSRSMIAVILLANWATGVRVSSTATAQEAAGSDTPTLEQVKSEGALRSNYRRPLPQEKSAAAPRPNLKAFRAEIEPTLRKACYGCHGPKKQKAKLRVDALDPDLIHGEDVDWWLEVSAVVNVANETWSKYLRGIEHCPS